MSNERFLNELLDARSVVFANGYLVRHRDGEWIAYKCEGEPDENHRRYHHRTDAKSHE